MLTAAGVRPHLLVLTLLLHESEGKARQSGATLINFDRLCPVLTSSRRFRRPLGNRQTPSWRVRAAGQNETRASLGIRRCDVQHRREMCCSYSITSSILLFLMSCFILSLHFSVNHLLFLSSSPPFIVSSSAQLSRLCMLTGPRWYPADMLCVIPAVACRPARYLSRLGYGRSVYQGVRMSVSGHFWLPVCLLFSSFSSSLSRPVYILAGTTKLVKNDHGDTPGGKCEGGEDIKEEVKNNSQVNGQIGKPSTANSNTSTSVKCV